jgi:hypothetical protein
MLTGVLIAVCHAVASGAFWRYVPFYFWNKSELDLSFLRKPGYKQSGWGRELGVEVGRLDRVRYTGRLTCYSFRVVGRRSVSADQVCAPLLWRRAGMAYRLVEDCTRRPRLETLDRGYYMICAHLGLGSADTTSPVKSRAFTPD